MIVNNGTRLGTLEWIPDGEAGTRVTLDRMRALVRAGVDDVMVRAAAQRVVYQAGVHPHSLGALKALFAFVRDQIRYVKDPVGIEQLSTPRRTLEKRNEDCDGKATLLVALIKSLRHPAAVGFRAISTNRFFPRTFTHVYAFARFGGRTFAMDPTYPRTAFGWQYGRAAAREDVLA